MTGCGPDFEDSSKDLKTNQNLLLQLTNWTWSTWTTSLSRDFNWKRRSNWSQDITLQSIGIQTSLRRTPVWHLRQYLLIFVSLLLLKFFLWRTFQNMRLQRSNRRLMELQWSLWQTVLIFGLQKKFWAKTIFGTAETAKNIVRPRRSWIYGSFQTSLSSIWRDFPTRTRSFERRLTSWWTFHWKDLIWVRRS